jgi:peptidoglycan/xylan/chitin deacetylase (PgdA/CDA1 family)
MIKIPLFVRKFFPSALWKVDSESKDVYLTFDDGPTPKVTREVLDLLSQYNAKATFFCLGNKVEKFPEVYQDLLESGHQIGNHSYSHYLGLKTKNKKYFEDIKIASKVINSSLFRPPYGKMKLSQYLFLKSRYKIVLWDLIPGDYKEGMTASKLVSNIIDNVSSGSIIVLHDSDKCAKVMLSALPVILKELDKKGYSFQSINN